MTKIFRPALIAAFIGALLVPCLYGTSSQARSAIASQEAMSLPSLTLQAWQVSAKNEKMAFLFGLATMIELEKEWQGANPLPISRSLNESWVRGLDGVPLGTMCAAVDKYITDHPSFSQMSVLEALGRIYVRPKLTDAELRQAADKARNIKMSR